MINLKKHLTKSHLRKVVFIAIVSLPVALFVLKFSLINRNGIFLGEDWDYFAQSYEAARVSILHFHQFPWWNPWMNGGQPLFANPQFGLVSIQTPLVLFFGTVAGLHFSVFVYYIIGFWGMYALLQRVGSTSTIITVLLSYIWTFSSFAAWHLGGGQLTFAIYFLAPWAFLTLLNIHLRLNWLWFALVTSLMILSAAHYLTIEILFICLLIAILQVGRQLYPHDMRNRQQAFRIIKPYVLSLIAIVSLTGFRLFHTLQFIGEYPRLADLDPPEPLRLFIASIMFRHPIDPAPLLAPELSLYGWTEYANYLGLITLALVAYLLIRRLERFRSISWSDWLIVAATFLAALITLGDFASWSPFTILHGFPLFEQMRVPSRFICWFGFGLILILAKLPRKPTIYVLLALSAIEVFAANYFILNYNQKPYSQAIRPDKSFQQYEFYQTNPELGQINIMNIQNLRLLRATQNNYGEVYGYEPILDIGEYYFTPGTSRCGINKGCSFVTSKNATVTSWSPHDISLKRTGTGPIELNMNPGKAWKVNGAEPFSDYRTLELKQRFVIKDTSKTVRITFDQ